MTIKTKNIMEEIVNDRMGSILVKMECCQCEQCMSDVASYVLNRIKPKYVSTVSGELFSKSVIMNTETENELIRLIVEAANIIKENPRH